MKNPWGIQPNHAGQESSINELLPHPMLEKAMKDAIKHLELAQHAQTTAPHGRLLAWEALDILRRALRGEYEHR
jgi:hypothetical protein